MAIKITKNLSTKVLSARVTPDVYSAWKSLAKSQNTSVSDCLRDAVTMVDKKSLLKAQDGMVVPEELNQVLGAIGGGSVAGILIYKGIRSTLEKNYSSNMSTSEIESVSIILALSGALLIGTGIYKTLK
jgi:hypothetical protein